LSWSNKAHNKIKKAYTGNSRTTKFRKYGPSGKFTKAAKLSQPITNFFNTESLKLNENKQEEEMEIEELENDKNVKSEGENESENDDSHHCVPDTIYNEIK
jgi:hypothetical protein